MDELSICKVHAFIRLCVLLRVKWCSIWKAKRKLSMVRSFLTTRSYWINYSGENFLTTRNFFLTTPSWDPLRMSPRPSLRICHFHKILHLNVTFHWRDLLSVCLQY